MKYKIILSVIVVGFILAGVSSFANLSFSDIVDSSDCNWETLEIEGQTFESLEDFKQAAESNGLDFEEINQKTDFRVNDGALEYRPNEGCGQNIQTGEN